MRAAVVCLCLLPMLALAKPTSLGSDDMDSMLVPAENETMSWDEESEISPAVEDSFVNETTTDEKFPRAADESSFNETVVESSEKMPRSVDEQETDLPANSTIVRRRRSLDNESFVNETSSDEKFPTAVNESMIVGNETEAERIEEEPVMVPSADAQPIDETLPEGFETIELDPTQQRLVHNLAALSEDFFILAEKINASRPEEIAESGELDGDEAKPDIVTDLTYLAEDLLTLAVRLNGTSEELPRMPRSTKKYYYYLNGAYPYWPWSYYGYNRLGTYEYYKALGYIDE